MIKKVEEADSKSQDGESWKLINEISRRKTSKKGLLKGKSQEERIKAWYIHFSNLLGKEPVTNNACEEEITTVLHQLNIKIGLFTVKEYQAVKRKLKEDKALGSDGISTEALKHCDFDDIIVKYANKLLIDQENQINGLIYTSFHYLSQATLARLRTIMVSRYHQLYQK